MALALRLARRGLARTSPNPMVGAVIVRDGMIVSTGWHRRAGDPHAEQVALAHLRGQARGATLYVNLEPCAHYGRTEPCAEAILRAGIKRVVVGMLDPNPLVSGRGIRRLRRSGVVVHVGALEAESQRLNEAFSVAIQLRRSFVTLKSAATLDGKTATRAGHSKWITDAAARLEAHRLRAAHDAVLVGAGTVRTDDPRLNVRGVHGHQPVRIVLDGQLRTSTRSRLFRSTGGPIWIVASKDAPQGRARAIEALGAKVLRISGHQGRIDIRALLRHLRKLGLNSVLVEGGAETHAAFLEARCVDRMVVFIAPMMVGGRNAIPIIGGTGVRRLAQGLRFDSLETERVGSCVKLDARRSIS